VNSELTGFGGDGYSLTWGTILVFAWDDWETTKKGKSGCFSVPQQRFILGIYVIHVRSMTASASLINTH
jgi:hypothetical protein